MDARYKDMKDNARVTTPPDLLGCDYIVEMASEIGLDHGGEPITFRELEAYCGMVGVKLSAWEALTIRSMSSAYCEWRNRAADPGCPPPYYTENRTKEQIREDVQNSVRTKFESLAKRNKRRRNR